MKTLNLIIALSATAALQASGALIPGLYNTGVNGGGIPLLQNQIDSNYTLTSVPSGSSSVVKARTSAGGYPIGPWLPDNTTSAWIGPDYADSASSGNLHGATTDSPPSPYVYEFQFNLTGYNPSTALITGQWASDDTGAMYLNGTPVSTSAGFTSWTSFALTSGFVSGWNTLKFVVDNIPLDTYKNPTGLRVEMRGDVSAVPEPSTYFAGISALGMLFLFGRKNRK